MLKLFTEHPASANQTYLGHLRFAVSFGFCMICGGLACVIHAIFPFLFQTTGSRTAFRCVENYLKQHGPHNDQSEECMLKDIRARKQKLNEPN